MSPAELDLRQYAVLGLVTEASRMALDYFRRRESLGVTMKGAQDWLTVADGAVEDFLRQRLAVLFPGDAVIGEEGGGAGERCGLDHRSDRRHLEFRARRPQLVHLDRLPAEPRARDRDRRRAGARRGLSRRRRGQGATMNGQPIAVSGASDITRAYVELGWSTAGRRRRATWR